MARILEKNVRPGKHAQHPALILVLNMSPNKQHDALQEKLLNASQHASKNRVKAVVLVVGLVAGGAAVLAGLSALVGERPAPSAPTIVANAPTPDEVAAMRDAFKEALKAYEQDLEADVLSQPFGAWNAEAQHDIKTAKARAIDLFSGSAYADAVQELQAASSQATQQLDAMNAAFDAAMRAAEGALEQDEFEQAKLHITKALSLRPTSVEAQSVGQKIDALPEVLSLVKAVQDARTQNDAEGEMKSLRALLALDPKREGLQARLDNLIIQTLEQRFVGHVKSALVCLEKRDLACAESNGAAAQKIFANRSEVTLLSSKISTLSRELKIERLLADADAAMQGDRWGDALVLLQNASAIDQGRKRIQDGLELAHKLTDLDGALDSYLSAPQRLGADNVANGARAVVAESDTYAQHSAALSAKAQNLKSVLSDYATKVSVLVRSDNLTDISVRGVGQVGRTKARAIELKPGTYTLEGIRPGYKAMLKTLVVPVGAQNLSIEVVCNEQL